MNRGQREPQKAVRQGQFEKFMAEQERDTGRKLAMLVQTYHERYVAPLEERLWWVEQPLWRKAWIRLDIWWRQEKAWWDTKPFRRLWRVPPTDG